jgi:hypothetical protein
MIQRRLNAKVNLELINFLKAEKLTASTTFLGKLFQDLINNPNKKRIFETIYFSI